MAELPALPVMQADVVAWDGRAIIVIDDAAAQHSLTAQLIEFGATLVALGRATINDDGTIVAPHVVGGSLPAALVVVTAVTTDTTDTTSSEWSPVEQRGALAVLPLMERIEAFAHHPGRGLSLAATLASAGVVTLTGHCPDPVAAARAVLARADELAGVPHVPPVPRSLTEGSAAADATLRQVIGNPALVPVAIDLAHRTVRFHEFPRPFDIAHAGIHPRRTDPVLGLAAVRAAAALLPKPSKVSLIYHHGYAGSTLLCRLLDLPGVCLGYSEPNVHYHYFDDPALRALCHRTFHADETPLMKTVPGEMSRARQHFAELTAARGLYFYAPLQDYVAATLRHAYRREYVVTMVRNVLGIECPDPGDAAATWWTWAAREALALTEAHPIKMLESDTFFADMDGALARVWEWFGYPPRTDWAETRARVSGTHAKTGTPFSPAQRQEQRREQAAEAQLWADAHQDVLRDAAELAAMLARHAV